MADVIAGIVLLVVLVVEAVYVLRIAPPDGETGERNGGARVPAKPSPKGPPSKAGGRRVDE